MAEATDNNINELLSLNYELEGLLLVAAKRDDAVPARVLALLAEKSALLHDGILRMLEEKRDDSVAELPVSGSLTAPADVPGCLDVIAADEVAAVDDVRSGSSVGNETVDEAVVSVDADASDVVAGENEWNETMPEAETADEEGAITADEQAIDDEYAVSVASEPMRLEEKLARESSRNLRKAFSLNDRFRFRRELFGNSDIEMTDTLNLVEAMTCYDEAVDYFMTDLQWDPENSEVKDFMSIIEKHFAIR